MAAENRFQTRLEAELKPVLEEVQRERQRAENSKATQGPQHAPASVIAEGLINEIIKPRMTIVAERLAVTEGMDVRYRPLEGLWECQCKLGSDAHISMFVLANTDRAELSLDSQVTRHGGDVRSEHIDLPLDSYDREALVEWIEAELVECAKVAARLVLIPPP